MEDEISYGTTENYELPYPNDYTDMADVPEVVKQLAEKIDTEMFGVVGDIGTAIDGINRRNYIREVY